MDQKFISLKSKVDQNQADLLPNIGTFCPKFITEKIFSNKLTKIRKLFLNVLVDQNDQKRHFLLHQDKLISGSI